MTIQEYKTFEDMNLSDEVLRGIYSIGYENPSAIQRLVIHPLINIKNRDIIAQSQSGTGKTAAFGIGVISRMQNSNGLSVILSPTRELAIQTYDCIKELSIYSELKTTLCVGGFGFKKCYKYQ